MAERFYVSNVSQTPGRIDGRINEQTNSRQSRVLERAN